MAIADVKKSASNRKRGGPVCNETYTDLLKKLRKVNRAAFIIANENTQTAVCALRSDLLVGWRS
jgi:hypothetical protein